MIDCIWMIVVLVLFGVCGDDSVGDVSVNQEHPIAVEDHTVAKYVYRYRVIKIYRDCLYDDHYLFVTME